MWPVGYMMAELKKYMDNKKVMSKFDVQQQMLIRKFNEENDGAMGKRIKLLKDAAAPVMAIIIFLLAAFGAFGLGWLIHS